jgi:hypothetical protein
MPLPTCVQAASWSNLKPGFMRLSVLPLAAVPLNLAAVGTAASGIPHVISDVPTAASGSPTESSGSKTAGSGSSKLKVNFKLTNQVNKLKDEKIEKVSESVFERKRSTDFLQDFFDLESESFQTARLTAGRLFAESNISLDLLDRIAVGMCLNIFAEGSDRTLTKLEMIRDDADAAVRDKRIKRRFIGVARSVRTCFEAAGREWTSCRTNLELMAFDNAAAAAKFEKIHADRLAEHGRKHAGNRKTPEMTELQKAEALLAWRRDAVAGGGVMATAVGGERGVCEAQNIVDKLRGLELAAQINAEQRAKDVMKLETALRKSSDGSPGKPAKKVQFWRGGIPEKPARERFLNRNEARKIFYLIYVCPLSSPRWGASP